MVGTDDRRLHVAVGLAEQLVPPVAADVVERPQHSVASLHDEDVLVADVQGHVVARFGERGFMGDVLPGAVEDRLLLPFVDGGVRVVAGGQGVGGLRLVRERPFHRRQAGRRLQFIEHRVEHGVLRLRLVRGPACRSGRFISRIGMGPAGLSCRPVHATGNRHGSICRRLYQTAALRSRGSNRGPSGGERQRVGKCTAGTTGSSDAESGWFVVLLIEIGSRPIRAPPQDDAVGVHPGSYWGASIFVGRLPHAETMDRQGASGPSCDTTALKRRDVGDGRRQSRSGTTNSCDSPIGTAALRAFAMRRGAC